MGLPRSNLRRSVAATSLVLAVGLAYLAVSGLDQDAGPTAPQAACGSGPGNAGYVGTQIQLDIGETILEADLILRGRVTSICDWIWNTSDGKDWTEEYEANPSAYETLPMPSLPVWIDVEEVIHANGGIPAVAAGQALEVMFLGTDLEPGDERVFMFAWSRMHGAMPEPKQVWVGDSGQREWLIQDEHVSPSDRMQAYSLATAVLKDRIEGRIDESNWSGWISLDTMRDVIGRELVTPEVDVAGFERWPWQPAYYRYEQIVNAEGPAAQPDPEDV